MSLECTFNLTFNLKIPYVPIEIKNIEIFCSKWRHLQRQNYAVLNKMSSTKQILEGEARNLIKHITQFSEDEENFPICERYVNRADRGVGIALFIKIMFMTIFQCTHLLIYEP